MLFALYWCLYVHLNQVEMKEVELYKSGKKAFLNSLLFD
jgi:hypothetical protein